MSFDQLSRAGYPSPQYNFDREYQELPGEAGAVEIYSNEIGGVTRASVTLCNRSAVNTAYATVWVGTTADDPAIVLPNIELAPHESISLPNVYNIPLGDSLWAESSSGIGEVNIRLDLTLEV